MSARYVVTVRHSLVLSKTMLSQNTSQILSHTVVHFVQKCLEPIKHIWSIKNRYHKWLFLQYCNDKYILHRFLLQFCWNILKCIIISGAGSISNPDDFDQYVQRGGSSGHYCQLCSYSQAQFSVVKNHIESKHFPNTFSYQCPFCNKNFGTNKAFIIHKNRYHKWFCCSVWMK